MTGYRPRHFSAWSRLLAILVAVASIAAAAGPSFALEIKRMKLNDGATLMVSEEHQLPMVTVEIAFDAGSRRDPAGKAGLAYLTAQSLLQGTSRLTAQQFNEKVDFLGSSVTIGAGRDFAVAGFTSLKRYEDQTLHLLASALQEPALRDRDIERKRSDQIADIHANSEQPDYVAAANFDKLLYGSGPYNHLPEGTIESVKHLTPKDVRSFYQTYYKLGSAVIAVVGDVNAEQVKAQLNKALTGLKGTVAPQARPESPKLTAGLHVSVINRNVRQANLIMGSVGIARSNPDYYRLQVMNYILGGGGFASRLMKTVRTRAGLAYSVYSGVEGHYFPGPIVIALQTKNASTNQALSIVLQQLHKIREQPVTSAELESAKKFLVGSFPLRLDRQSSIAGFMLDEQLYKLGADYVDRYPKLINAVTISDVHRMARKYLHPDDMLMVAVADKHQAAINVGKLKSEAAKSDAGGQPSGH